ncbi:MAG TPA: aminotransferase class V-fold PLP-dependent enzyme, partial [Pyrodictium sp.]|nr:aminotransferase class V-fold PLP-dependent enzyme [Pyrodictium sp.]
REIPFHTDGVQAITKISLSLDSIDFATFSAHKFHAPKGIGILYRKEKTELEPLLVGGGQEFGLRSGTENIIGIYATAKTLEYIYFNYKQNINHLRKLQNKFESSLLELFPDIKIIGREVKRSFSISSVIFPKGTAYEIVNRLSEKGIYCSIGSACTSGEPKPNKHLLDMGYTVEEAERFIRFSFGLMNTEEEIDITLKAIKQIFK